MSATLSGAGGASCQLCTANHTQLKDLNLIEDGFSINHFIHDAKNLFKRCEQSRRILEIGFQIEIRATTPTNI